MWNVRYCLISCLVYNDTGSAFIFAMSLFQNATGAKVLRHSYLSNKIFCTQYLTAAEFLSLLQMMFIIPCFRINYVTDSVMQDSS